MKDYFILLDNVTSKIFIQLSFVKKNKKRLKRQNDHNKTEKKLVMPVILSLL